MALFLVRIQDWSRRLAASALASAAVLACSAERADAVTGGQTCFAAAERASRQTGVPVSVLKAISLTETGRRKNGSTQTWPWTVNMEGKGVWFDDPDSAKAYVYKNYKRGARSFDVGCFQINYKWHGSAFDSIEQMFDPDANALYAARFLSDLYRETRDWSKAAGAYHSRTKKYADRYKKRFDRFRAIVANAAPEPSVRPVSEPVTPGAPPAEPQTAPTTTQVVKRVNRYPLLVRRDTPSGLGSLVPLQSGAARSLFATPEAES